MRPSIWGMLSDATGSPGFGCAPEGSLVAGTPFGVAGGPILACAIPEINMVATAMAAEPPSVIPWTRLLRSWLSIGIPALPRAAARAFAAACSCALGPAALRGTRTWDALGATTFGIVSATSPNAA